MSSDMDYHIAAEPDVSTKLNRKIWAYFIVLATGLFITIAALTVMFTFQVDYQKKRKIGEIQSKEALDQMALSKAYLAGNKGLLEGKHYVSVDVAITKFITEAQRVK